jgi:hypothetical protein
MSQDSDLLCKQCGARSVSLLVRPGRSTKYRNMLALAVPDDFPVPTCGRCGAEQLDAVTRAALAPLLHEEYRRTLRLRVRRAIDTLSQHISQRRLELLLGLSQGYLSRLRSGSGNPSPELVSHLALIALDPKLRLTELERYWAEPTVDSDHRREPLTGFAPLAPAASSR